MQCGVVEMRLLSKVSSSQQDNSNIDDPKYVYEPLPVALNDRLATLSGNQVTVLVRLQGEFGVVGMDALVAWGVRVNPKTGLEC